MEDNIKNTCRLCVQECDENSVYIFHQSSIETPPINSISVPMRIAAVIAIEINQNDGLPVKLCGECRYRLELSYYFKKRCQISDAKLRKHYKLLSLGKTSNVFSKENEEDDSDDSSLEESMRFLKNYENLRNVELINRISLELHEESQKKLDSLRTELTSKLKTELAAEVKNEVRLELEPKLREESLNKAREEVKLEFENKCRKEELKNILNDIGDFLQSKQLQRKTNVGRGQINSKKSKETPDDLDQTSNRHEISLLSDRQSSSDSITIKIPAKSSNTEENIKSFDIEVSSEIPLRDDDQSDGQQYSCNEITYEIEEEDDLQIAETEHSIVEHIERIAVLNYSDEESILKNNDEQLEMVQIIDSAAIENPDPMKKITNEKDIETGFNKVQFIVSQPSTTSKTISVGRQTVTPKNFKCKFCPVTTSTKNSLERHLRVHFNGVKSVACPECKIVVSCRSALRRHSVLHSGEKPYICGVCDKAFAQREILKRHENTQHKGLRRHKCSQCEREFSQKINLTEHFRQHHSGEGKLQRYKCHLCSKSFCHSSGLSRHLALHSGVSYQCVKCVRCFADRSSVKRHILKVHGIEKAQQMILEIGQKDLQTKKEF